MINKLIPPSKENRYGSIEPTATFLFQTNINEVWI